MDLKGERFIPQPIESVWQALNDIEVLKATIPGCQEISWAGKNQLEATVKAKVGPVKATFKGSVSLENMQPPKSYSIVGQGKGGAAGFAKGSAHVTLEEKDAGTLLKYDVEATVGGKLAQVGSRLIQGTAKKLSAEFFDALTVHLGGEIAKPDEGEQTASGLPPYIWVSGLIILVLASLWHFT